MAKIHTHYDNLKVARLAPQEVIRAAYKALSQKYHPDKNPGDEKAARIMAILNSAYTTLSDNQRRKEHDEWIAAEEWEIEWLASTHEDEGHAKAAKDDGGWNPEHVETNRRKRAPRDRRVWIAVGAMFALGCIAGALVSNPPKLISVALASALGSKAEARIELKPELDALRMPAKPALPAADKWAAAKPLLTDTVPLKVPEVKVLAVSQVLIPARAADCDTELHTLVAPNGEPWPQRSGYVDGYAIGNRGEQLQVLVDNSANASPVFVRLVDLEQRASVRHLFVLAHDSMTVDQLASGRYELRYQNVEVGADKIECPSRKGQAIKQAAIDAN
jgi:hypothetical protein